MRSCIPPKLNQHQYKTKTNTKTGIVYICVSRKEIETFSTYPFGSKKNCTTKRVYHPFEILSVASISINAVKFWFFSVCFIFISNTQGSVQLSHAVYAAGFTSHGFLKYVIISKNYTVIIQLSIVKIL